MHADRARSQGEKTARALDLTRQLISFNGADYTAWQWRWQCVEALGADVEEEMALTEWVQQCDRL